eukprot:1149107-Pelagomonas_calceolata.AAC.2
MQLFAGKHYAFRQSPSSAKCRAHKPAVHVHAVTSGTKNLRERTTVDLEHTETPLNTHNVKGGKFPPFKGKVLSVERLGGRYAVLDSLLRTPESSFESQRLSSALTCLAAPSQTGPASFQLFCRDKERDVTHIVIDTGEQAFKFDQFSIVLVCMTSKWYTALKMHVHAFSSLCCVTSPLSA